MTIGGVSVASGTSLTPAQVRSIPKLEALVANGSIVSVPDPYARRVSRHPGPAYLQPGLRNITSLTGEEGVTSDVWDFVALPADAYVFDFGDGNNAVADADGTISHTYASSDTYTVVATAGMQQVSIDIVVTVP
jgi:hypothetical protein